MKKDPNPDARKIAETIEKEKDSGNDREGETLVELVKSYGVHSQVHE